MQLESNKLALIEQRNDKNPTKPKVRSFYSVKLNQYVEAKDIDLAKTDDHIVKAVRAEEFDLDMNAIIDMLFIEA